MLEINKNMKRLYTEEGVKALENRLKNTVELYMKKPVYPVNYRMYGFVNLKIHSKEHHEGMIDELTQLLGKEKVVVEVK
jgi:hypothetical protein